MGLSAFTGAAKLLVVFPPAHLCSARLLILVMGVGGVGVGFGGCFGGPTSDLPAVATGDDDGSNFDAGSTGSTNGDPGDPELPALDAGADSSSDAGSGTPEDAGDGGGPCDGGVQSEGGDGGCAAQPDAGDGSVEEAGIEAGAADTGP